LLTSAWQKRGPAAWLLLPLALGFAALVALRRQLYRIGLLRSERLGVPVIVVGNITAGGSGKTPLVLHIANGLAQRGFRPGVISRGYSRRAASGGDAHDVQQVFVDSDPDTVGDEPLLLKRRFGGPVFVGARRAAVGKTLCAVYPECDVIICDDGLQHYALHRDVEIAVIDRRGAMNGWPLPAGPLREPVSRLAQVDAVALNGSQQLALSSTEIFRFELVGALFFRLDDPAQIGDAKSFSGKQLHAVAGIGDPGRFFDHLTSLGLSPDVHPFPDHHAYTAADLDFDGDAILTTEKDAVKFGALARLPVWVLPVEAKIEPDLIQFLLEKLHGRPSA
jgi:tetraacyldisaccharide 4'-kinase